MVGIIMGSKSDLAVMKEAAEVLDYLKVKYELTIVSAHRTPDRMVEYARSANSRGVKVIVAVGIAPKTETIAVAIDSFPLTSLTVSVTMFNPMQASSTENWLPFIKMILPCISISKFAALNTFPAISLKANRIGKLQT